MTKKEKALNKYYNKGRFNNPGRIGYMMKIIRKAKPSSEKEWKDYYFTNVNKPEIIDEISEDMYKFIPSSEKISKELCREYIIDVMFRRTYEGWKKEEQAFKILQKHFPTIQEAPEDWDNIYFIDFYFKSKGGRLIGIQLKPETFYSGRYNKKVDIEGKHRAFREKYNAKTFILTYKQLYDNNKVVLTDPSIIDEIKAAERDYKCIISA